MTPTEHRIDRMKPAEHWTLLVDETGSRFDCDDPSDANCGRVVVLAVPKRASLVGVQSFHAVEKSTSAVLKHLDSVLASEVGIFGLASSARMHRSGHTWAGLVFDALEIALLELPMDGETNISLIVEQRGGAREGDYHAGLTNLRTRLRRIDPARERALKRADRELRVVPKGGHTWLAYADVVAWCWQTPQRRIRNRMKRAGLLDRCLFDRLEPLELDAIHLLAEGTVPTLEQWTELLRLADERPHGLAPLWRDRLMAKASADPTRWTVLQQAVEKLVTDRTMDLAQAMRAVRCLAGVRRPDDLALSAAVVLACMELNLANHRGEVLEERAAAVLRAAQQLRDEDPALACQAVLLAGVTLTNAYRFTEARKLATEDLTGSVAELGGLRQAGRSASFRGQLATFIGEFAEAEEHFASALALFQRLSDPAEAERERVQTATYRAIAATDDPQRDPAEVEALVGEVVPLDLEGVARMSVNHEHVDQYRHHLLVRTLAMLGTRAQADAYIGGARKWQYPFGHPWPLIRFYRGLLQGGEIRAGGRGLTLAKAGEQTAGRDHVEGAIAACMASDLGPVMHLMALALHRVGREIWPDLDSPSVDRRALRAALPGAGAAIDSLDSPRAGRPLRDLLGEVLPFNFH